MASSSLASLALASSARLRLPPRLGRHRRRRRRRRRRRLLWIGCKDAAADCVRVGVGWHCHTPHLIHSANGPSDLQDGH